MQNLIDEIITTKLELIDKSLDEAIETEESDK